MEAKRPRSTMPGLKSDSYAVIQFIIIAGAKAKLFSDF